MIHDKSHYYGLYIGYIRDVSDPEKTGRIRCYCPEVMGDADDSTHWLDWALPSLPWTAHEGIGLNVTPEGVDAKKWGTWLSFRQGDPRFPVWLGLFSTVGLTKETARFAAEKLIEIIGGGTRIRVETDSIKLGANAVEKIVKGSTFWTAMDLELTQLLLALQSVAAAAQGPLAALQPGVQAAIAAIQAFKNSGAGESYLSQISRTE